jgi:hypothetical protein
MDALGFGLAGIEGKALRPTATPKVELRDGAEPHGLILRNEAKLRVSKDDPVRSLACGF